jgi:hypothetical protein
MICVSHKLEHELLLTFFSCTQGCNCATEILLFIHEMQLKKCIGPLDYFVIRGLAEVGACMSNVILRRNMHSRYPKVNHRICACAIV